MKNQPFPQNTATELNTQLLYEKSHTLLEFFQRFTIQSKQRSYNTFITCLVLIAANYYTL